MQGCISLISSGDDPTPSYFLGASANGSNVFFGTHARLAPQDTDESGDLYDARIGGSFPVPAGKGPCEGAACQSPPPAPIDATPGSLTFSGPGNLLPVASPATPVKKTTKKKTARCKRGYVRKKVKRKTECVRARKATKSTKQRGR